VDYVITHPFNHEVAALSAMDFMLYLRQHLRLSRLFVGYDFALGRGREGNVPRLQELGRELDYSIELLPPFEIDGQIVSSSLVRRVLAEGDAERAARLLGRPYRIPGQVILGDGRGRTIGIPTANLDVWPRRALPKAGVYVCRAWVNGQSRGAVTNVGVRPTFESQPVQPRVEAHILDYDQDLYGQTITLDFLSHVRDEQRFPNVQALVEQIHRDIETARERLAAA
jgi:riboflavin kinase/FMN adenylyltransferase